MLFSSPSKAHQEIVNPFTSEGQISHHCKKIKRKEKEKKERCNVCKICEKSSSKPCPSAASCATKTRGHLQPKLLRVRRARCPVGGWDRRRGARAETRSTGTGGQGQAHPAAGTWRVKVCSGWKGRGCTDGGRGLQDAWSIRMACAV